MSNTVLDTSSSVTIQSSHASTVNADQTLLEFYEKLDTDYDLKIDLEANWNDFFRSVSLPGPSGDDTDDSPDGNDISGADYITFDTTDNVTPESLMESAKHATSSSISNEYWAGCPDGNRDNDNNNGARNSHLQSVARGLVGLFSSSSALSLDTNDKNVIVLEENGDDEIAGADSQFDIRVSQTEVLKWMSYDTSGSLGANSYGAEVFKTAQIRQLLTACSDMGRYHIEGSTVSKASEANTRAGIVAPGHRTLALRQGDRLQVRVTVHDKVGHDASIGSNSRVWLVSLMQGEEGRYSDANGFQYTTA